VQNNLRKRYKNHEEKKIKQKSVPMHYNDADRKQARFTSRDGSTQIASKHAIKTATLPGAKKKEGNNKKK